MAHHIDPNYRRDPDHMRNPTASPSRFAELVNLEMKLHAEAYRLHENSNEPQGKVDVTQDEALLLLELVRGAKRCA